MRKVSLYRRVRGLTLIELMVALMVITITLSLGAPSMQGLLQGNRLRSESIRFLRAINLARSEAVMRNRPVSICPSAMAVSGKAQCSGAYVDGWIVFANINKDKVVDTGTDEVLQVFEGLPSGYRLTNRNGTRAAFTIINFLPSGFSHSNRTLLFCPSNDADAESLSIVINNVGRARLMKGRGKCHVM
ncbi:MAG: GspH/FimT family pseudopilin [Halioglobus sp.]|nr:GspH/FimT family pseudopilin [Halioglobus sp.]